MVIIAPEFTSIFADSINCRGFNDSLLWTVLFRWATPNTAMLLGQNILSIFSSFAISNTFKRLFVFRFQASWGSFSPVLIKWLQANKSALYFALSHKRATFLYSGHPNLYTALFLFSSRRSEAITFDPPEIFRSSKVNSTPSCPPAPITSIFSLIILFITFLTINHRFFFLLAD